MSKLHEFDYIFAIAMIFAALDAWNIGANDVANSFASSVSSRSLKYWQAMILAAIMEFLGAVLAGARVSDAIRSKIIDIHSFDTPAVLMLTMACALIGSSIWLSCATKIGMPVSTTHSIVGAVIGSGIAAVGADNIVWGWKGFSQIVASWFIAPAISGGFASIVFLISKYGVLERKNSLRNAFFLIPCCVYLTFSVLTMLIVWKGAPNLKLNKLSSHAIIGSIFGVGGVATAVYLVWLHPYLYRRVVHQDWTLKWYHAFLGPIYWFKSTDDIPPMPQGHLLVPDYYEGKRFEEYKAPAADEEEDVGSDEQKLERDLENLENKHKADSSIDSLNTAPLEAKKQTTAQLWFSLLKQPTQWPRLVWLVLIHGFVQDVISNQVNASSPLTGDIRDMHSRAKYYDNKIEYLFSLLQAVTACTMSFAHGSNDIANAAGPLSTVYQIWSSNKIPSKSDVPVWVLCYTAACLVIGCWTYGYNIMRNLGNRLTLQSPSRGFAIELGTALTTVIATQLSIPVSTTQEAVGATVFVGFCNKDVKAVNWRIVLFCYLGWIVTLPCAGIIAGVINGIILNAPREGGIYTLQA
ncbi:hypothetical protein WICPIJ_000065 [Wickerhamomyces pijperi]|uniref:Phosphate transporter n=1 Tax=Wickerhamomyces pijperi TaxID=599730 RepID=A0A9P8TSA9_WICPI|nr:hypothetical protein WICPIJ_000065 [Wickerhamomyces pijperi]